MRQDHNQDGARPWRGMKRDNWEGGHRVPFIVRWPGKVAPSSTNHQIVSQCDVFATVAELVGTRLPVHVAEDSFCLLRVLTRVKTPDLFGPIYYNRRSRELVIWQFAVESGNISHTRVPAETTTKRILSSRSMQCPTRPLQLLADSLISKRTPGKLLI